jgi:hypothetical protein
MKIPTIDVSMWIKFSSCDWDTKFSAANEEALLSIAKKWNDAITTFGFAVIIGHGVPNTLIDDLDSQLLEFFTSKTFAEKMAYNHGSYGSASGGYTPVGLEAVTLSTEATSGSDDKPPIVNETSRGPSKPLKALADPVESFVFPFSPKLFQLPNGTDPGVADSNSSREEERRCNVFPAADR